jgi:hypothetical protein
VATLQKLPKKLLRTLENRLASLVESFNPDLEESLVNLEEELLISDPKLVID